MLIHCFFVPRTLGAGVHRALKHGFVYAARHVPHKIGHALVAAPVRAVSIKVCVAIGFGFAGGAGPVDDGALLPPIPPTIGAPTSGAGLLDIPVAFDPDWFAAPIDPLLTVDPGDPSSLSDDPPPTGAVAEPPGILVIALGLLAGVVPLGRRRFAA
jgi:hypothetical protein